MPPSPSIVSPPEPPLIVLAAAEPMIDIPVDTPLPLTLVMPLIEMPLPEAWLRVLARFRFTAASRYRVVTPEPPLIEVSVPWK